MTKYHFYDVLVGYGTVDAINGFFHIKTVRDIFLTKHVYILHVKQKIINIKNQLPPANVFGVYPLPPNVINYIILRPLIYWRDP